MSSRENLKIAVDIALFLLLVFCMGFHLWGMLAHEIAGTAMLALLIVHNLLNRHWYKSILRGRYSAVRLWLSVLVLMVLAAGLALAYSSEIISKYVFAFLPDWGSQAQAHRLHLWAAYWGMMLMSLHLGLHWSKFMRLGDFSGVVLHGKWLGIAAKIAAFGIAAYGAYAFVARSCLDYLLFRSVFFMFDRTETAGGFYVDYLCIMGAGIFVSHYLAKALRKIGGSI